MRVVRRANEHNAVARRSAHAEAANLVMREPQLIKLPIPIPTLPLVGGLLAPIVGGSSPTTTKHANTPTPTPQKPNNPTTTKAASPPAQSTKPATPTNNGGGSAPTPTTGGSTGGTGGSPDTGNGNTGNPGGSPNDGSTGGNTDPGTGNTNPGTGNTDPQTGTGGTDPSTPSNPDGTTTSPGTGTGTDPNQPVVDPSTGVANPGTVLTGGTSTEPGTTSPDGTTNSGSNGGSNFGSSGGVSNAGQLGGGNNPNGGSGGGNGVKATGANGLPLPTGGVGGLGTGSGSGGSNGGGVDNGDGGSNGGGGGKGGGLSAGGIAGIILLLIFLIIGILIFIKRRRNKARRDDRSHRWWFARKRVSKEFSEKDAAAIWSPSRQSHRSSFGTSADHFAASPPQFVNFDTIPSLPPVAGMGRADGASPNLATEFGITAERRYSGGSEDSSSTGHGQWLVVTHRASEDDQALTPMSVRPFSPSESFAFPRPPDPAGDRTSAYSRPSSSGTVVSGYRGTSRTTSMSPTPPTPAIPAGVYLPGVKEHDPFADNNPFDDANSSEGHQAPFVLPTGFAEQEYIRRPFAPTLPDELAVTVGEPVRLLRVFDDGWTLVQRVKADGTSSGLPEDQGLIPLDCLRELGKDLPTFIAEKRVSGYAPSSVNGSFNAF